MPLDPNHNLFSVAPIGPNIMIARSAALKGAIARDRALNLIGWLVIATGATRKEILDVIKAANGAKPEPVKPALPAVSVPRVAPVRPAAPRPVVVPAVAPTVTVAPIVPVAPAVPVVPPELPPNDMGAPPVSEAVAVGVKPFIGAVDPEEARALAEAATALGKEMDAAQKTKPVDSDAIEADWTE